MQNKGAIKFCAILFALICAYQLSFTLITQRIERRADTYANAAFIQDVAKELAAGDAARERFITDSIVNVRHQYFTDSVNNLVVYNLFIDEYTYKECKEREINLGLDLRGGMDVMMEVSIADVVRALSGHSEDPTFNAAMDNAIERSKITANSDFVSMFAEAWSEIAPNEQMAAIFINKEIGTIKMNSTNDEVIAAIRTETDDAFERTYQILRKRIDKFGVAQPNIQKMTRTQRIRIELPGVKEPERVKKLLQGTAQLEFWETHKFGEIAQELQNANDYLASTSKIDSIMGISGEMPDSVDSTETDTVAAALNEENMTDEELRKQNPLFSVLIPSLGNEFERNDQPIAGYALQKDIPTVDLLLQTAMNANQFRRDIKFAWAAKPLPGSDLYQLIALKINTREGIAPLTGDVIVDARQDYNQTGAVEVSMAMNNEGAKIWKNLTGANVNRAIAVVLDNYAYSWPNVNDEITGGRSSITGSFSVEEGQDLANILKAGKLPAPAQIVQEAVVGPSLGQQAINSGVMSFIIAFIMVLVYMLFFYNKAGIVANVALLTNSFFLLGVLASFGAVLTLPGIAGIVLTFGMAVDANVIIYERIKEELRSGKGLRLAIADGYKNSYSAIIDGNVTTLLTAIILNIFGTGPIQGFATTLAIGILTSLFTAIFITRLVITWMLDKNYNVTFDHSLVRNFLQHTNFDILKKRRYSYVIVSALILLSVGFLSTRGLSLGIDFQGGRTYVVCFDQNVETQDVRDALAAEFGEAPDVKTFGPTNQVKIATKYMINDVDTATDKLVESKLYNGVKKFYKAPISEIEFNDEHDGKLVGQLSSEMVGPTMATDIKRSAFVAIVVALFGIFGYIAIRFKKWQFGLGGAVALIFNAVLTLGVFSMFYGIMPFSMEIDQSFIAAILTVIGYAINDTVIIFDRIRENMGLFPKHTLRQQMNTAFNSTLSRTFNTSISTLLVLVIIFIFGGEVIRGFTFALMFGIFIGTLSTYFVASPIAFDLLDRFAKKKAVKKIA